MSKKSGLLAIVLVLLIGAAVSGCGGKSDSGSAQSSASKEPVNLLLYTGTTLTDEEFTKFIAEPVQKKFPHITVTLDRRDETNTREALAVSPNPPDLIYDSDTLYWGERGINLLEPLDSYIQKYKFDTGVIKSYLQKGAKDPVKGYWDSLPVSGNFVVNWVNKDVFDKFGVAYPKGVQTWDEILELNRKLVGQRDGVNYVGMYPDFHFMGQGLGIVYIDPKTYKATVNNDQWKKILTVVKNTVDLPGFIQNNKYNYRRDEWLKDKNVGMVIATGNQMIGPLTEMYNSGSPMNWDMAPFPNFKEKLGSSPATGGQKIILTNKSKHKDEAFQVMAHLLSEEVQTLISQSGKVPSINNAKVEKQFGTGVDSLKGKNVLAIFETTPLPEVESTEWNSTIGKKVMDGYVKKIALENMDINTALRQAEEEINKQVAQVLSGQQ
jgi:multiple sugar transport system substrate-binding protein